MVSCDNVLTPNEIGCLNKIGLKKYEDLRRENYMRSSIIFVIEWILFSVCTKILSLIAQRPRREAEAQLWLLSKSQMSWATPLFHYTPPLFIRGHFQNFFNFSLNISRIIEPSNIGCGSRRKIGNWLTHWGRVTQICVFTLQLCKTDEANPRF